MEIILEGLLHFPTKYTTSPICLSDWGYTTRSSMMQPFKAGPQTTGKAKKYWLTREKREEMEK